MYEHHKQPLASRKVFAQRVMRNGLIGAGMIFMALGIGVLGYHVFEGFSWIDSLLNASMILGGMGPVNTLQTVVGKLFASFYSQGCGRWKGDPYKPESGSIRRSGMARAAPSRVN